ncbi:MAG: DUF1223 domain-containing protein [Alphaproteobacteria bacterium]
MFRPVRIFLTALLLGAPFALTAAAPSVAADGGKKIVVELFTSQGCSSCPPADAYLAELAKRDDVIALSFHVDYWNYIGWTDPFSSPEATARQRAYGRTLGKRYVYTPQIVVDGRAEAVGSHRDAVDNLIKMAVAVQKISIDVTHVKDGTAEIAVPAGGGRQRGELWIGFYDDGGTTAVGAGENAGETITNANIVRVFRRIGAWDGTAETHRVDLKALGASGRDGCVVVLQAANNGPILGAASFPLTGGS